MSSPLTRALRELELFNDESDDFLPSLVQEKARRYKIDETRLMNEIKVRLSEYRKERQREEGNRKFCPHCGEPL